MEDGKCVMILIILDWEAMLVVCNLSMVYFVQFDFYSPMVANIRVDLVLSYDILHGYHHQR